MTRGFSLAAIAGRVAIATASCVAIATTAGCVHEQLVDGQRIESQAERKRLRDAELSGSKLSDTDIANLQAISAESTGCDASLITISEYHLVPPTSQTWWATCLAIQFVCANESVPICQRLHPPAAPRPTDDE